MADYPIGGGGGPAGAGTENSGHALDKPYDLFGPWTGDMADQVNEMMSLLFRSATKSAADIATIQATPAAASTSTEIWTLATVSVPKASLETMATVPVILAAAPGVGYAYTVGNLSIAVTQSAAYAAAGGWDIQHDGVPGINLVLTMNADLNNNRNKFFQRSGASVDAVGVNVTNTNNKALLLIAQADPTGAGNASATVTITYRKVVCPA